VLQSPTGVLTSKEDVQPFNVDWMHKFKGDSSVVLRPKTTQQVSDILKHCNSRKYVVVGIVSFSFFSLSFIIIHSLIHSFLVVLKDKRKKEMLLI
jgi:hypothetical protein